MFILPLFCAIIKRLYVPKMPTVETKIETFKRLFEKSQLRQTLADDDLNAINIAIAQENLLVGTAQDFLRRVLGLGRAGAGGGDREYRGTEAEGRRHS